VLRSDCRKALTEYMIPRHFLLIDSLPLSNNGKVDKDRLPAPSSLSKGGPAMLRAGDCKVVPRIPLEGTARAAMAIVLGVAEDEICVANDSFYSLGGTRYGLFFHKSDTSTSPDTPSNSVSTLPSHTLSSVPSVWTTDQSNILAADLQAPRGDRQALTSAGSLCGTHCPRHCRRARRKHIIRERRRHPSPNPATGVRAPTGRRRERRSDDGSHSHQPCRCLTRPI
jgi:hypothetical protein